MYAVTVVKNDIAILWANLFAFNFMYAIIVEEEGGKEKGSGTAQNPKMLSISATNYRFYFRLK